MARRKTNKPTKKKLLTLDDLYSFYLEQNKTCKFSSEKSGYQLSVQVPAHFEVSDEEVDQELERLAVAYRTDVESLREYASEGEIKAIKDDLAIQKAADLIMANVKERAKPKKKAKEEGEEETKAE